MSQEKDKLNRMLYDLIHYVKAFDILYNELQNFEKEISNKSILVSDIWVTRKDIISMISKYLNKEITAHTLMNWAAFMLGSDYIDFEPGYRSIVFEVLDNLADPPRSIDRLWAEEQIQELTNSTFDIQEVN